MMPTTQHSGKGKTTETIKISSAARGVCGWGELDICAYIFILTQWDKYIMCNTKCVPLDKLWYLCSYDKLM